MGPYLFKANSLRHNSDYIKRSIFTVIEFPIFMLLGIIKRISIGYIAITHIPEWLAIANDVRTAIASSDKIIFIPELNMS